MIPVVVGLDGLGTDSFSNVVIYWVSLRRPSSGRRRDVHIAGSASGKIVSGKASDTRAAARPATMAVVVLGVETAGMVAVGITGPYQPSPGDPDFGCSKEDGGDLFSSGGELPSLWGYGQQDDRSRRVVYISRSVA